MGFLNGDIKQFVAKNLAVCTLSLSDFRSYDKIKIEVPETSVVITGHNGAGKTNILEALSFLVPGRGMKKAKLSEICRQTSRELTEKPIPPWAISAQVKTPKGMIDIATGLDPQDLAQGRERRIVKINKVQISNQSELGKTLSIVWLTPDMSSLFIQGASQRRRFIDRLVASSDPAHSGRIRAYEKATRERLHLLASKDRTPDAVWLSVLENTIAEKGCAIAVTRLNFVDDLTTISKLNEGLFPASTLEMVGELEDWIRLDSALIVEDRLKETLEKTRAADSSIGKTQVGPHLSDLKVIQLEKNLPAEFCSTGEQKELLISLILSHGKLCSTSHGQPSLFLLDEVTAHLDKKKRLALFETLDKIGCQAWLTGTDPSLFEGMLGRATFLKLDNGKVQTEPH